ncbi:LacI family DNA-binding transcriptional regulator [Micromonospora sp. NBC_01813]|uniref:LacI family DNA-binding transcriptional regulator n=1 Tax=Micromonospora sp. NBC_01813 TaxID=2975988 RepID=UPI002DD9E9F1|nr:LacI family DNA-binding transcriptional regulator [Micromonospora sp. NBC_01813]WSA10045.1 LacI family transcriptional regulator [Micromonospora sp. NBC_01813]
MTTGPGVAAPPPGQRRKVSSHDIARLAGVSQSTVSRVLNNHPRITAVTRNRVMAAMEQLRYTPNAAARTLITGRSQLIGLVVSNITNPFYPQLIEAIVATAAEHDYNVVLGNTQESPRRQLDYLKLLVEHQVDGAILTSALQSGSDDLHRVIRAGTPVVLVNRTLSGGELDSVHIDNRRGGALATQHLIRLGHRRIAFAGGREDTSTNRLRLDGYRQAMSESGIEIDPALVVHGDFTHLSGGITAHRLLAVGQPPTAVVCADDVIAFGCIDALHDRRVRVPEDVAVVGFDDVPVAALKGIGLTTVRQPAPEMGRRAFDLLLRRITGEDPARPPVEEVLPAELVIRDTCGARLVSRG